MKPKIEQRPLSESPSDPRLKWKIWRSNDGVKLQAYTSGTFSCPANGVMWVSWEHFEGKVTPEELKALAACYEVQIPKRTNKVDLSLLVWEALCEKAVLTTSGSVAPPVKPSNKKAPREYCLVEGHESKMADLTPQARTCAILLAHCIAAGDGPSVYEETFKQFLAENAGELNTRQDPWRIFQYYRANMISEGIIRST